MSDDVRHPREFEPPPWERDQFDELRRRRELEQAQSDEAASAAGEAQPPPGAAPEPAAGPGGGRASRVRADGLERDQAEVDLMMLELASEEPDVAQPFRRAGMVIAAIVALVGFAIVVAGIAALVVQGARGGVMGGLAGAVVIVFGALLMAGGGWLTILALRQRGA